MDSSNLANEIEFLKAHFNALGESEERHFRYLMSLMAALGLFITIFGSIITFFSFSSYQKVHELDTKVALIEQRLGTIEAQIRDIQAGLRVMPSLAEDIEREREEREAILKELRSVNEFIQDHFKTAP